MVSSVHSRVPWASLVFVRSISRRILFACVRPFPERPVGRRVRLLHSRAPWKSKGTYGGVRPIPVRPVESSGTFGCVHSIYVRLGCLRVLSRAFGCVVMDVGFVRSISVRPCRSLGFIRVRSVHSCAP